MMNVDERMPLNGSSMKISTTEDDEKSMLRSWKYVGIICGVSAVGCIVYTTGSFTSPAQNNSASQVAFNAWKPHQQMRLAAFDDSQKRDLFNEFKNKFDRKYETSAEEAIRYGKFKNFLEMIDKRNEAEANNGGTAVHGITKYADWDQTEMKKHLMGYVAMSKSPVAEKLRKKSVDKPPVAGDRQSVDWSVGPTKLTTAVKDQGYCGSCWAFSATEQIESDAIRMGLENTDLTLSTQQIVSCDTIDFGCEGGNTETAYAYVHSAGGLTTDTVYPYTSYWGKTGKCQSVSEDELMVTVESFVSLAHDEEDMSDYVLSTGPLSVCLDASEWSSYVSGVVSVCGKDIDHCVQITGVNLEDENNPYWTVRNSWGTSWGLDGFIQLSYGSDLCGITTDPTYSIPYKVSA